MTQDTAITNWLRRWREGDAEAAEKVASSVYEELRRLASYYLSEERRGHTLQPTALVNEMFLRLIQSAPVDWKDRAHFFAVAARQLRRILVNHARDRQAEKRGGKQVRIELRDDQAGSVETPDLLEVDTALDSLAKIDARSAKVIELRFFAGLTELEIAEALGTSLAGVKRDWAFGRAWLLTKLGP